MEPGGGPTDADLVVAAVAGDRDAFAAIYDRYADRVFSTCVRLLRNRDDAADVCGDVFLVAAERLDQLRDPSKLRPWLFAIARRQVYLRTDRRSRTVPVDDMSDVTSADPLASVALGPDAPVESAVEGAELAALVQQAADGLDDGDRTVLQLQLAGLEGADLADALGVSATNAYQASHRMKERLERSLGALLVARQGRADCADLDRVLADWDGRFSVLWRKRVARHVDGCEVCERRRKAVPALLFEGVAAATPVLAVPVSVRDRVLADPPVGLASGRRWSGDGFPPPDGRGRRRAAAVLAVAAVVLLALLGGIGAAVLGEEETVLADGPGDTSPPRPPSTTVAAAPGPTSGPGSVLPGATPPTTAPVAGLPPATPGQTSPTTATTVTTVAPSPPSTPSTTTTVPPAPPAPPPDTRPPTVRLVGPTSRPCGGVTQPFTAVVADTSAVSSVVLQWTNGSGTSGSEAMADTGSGWTATYRPNRWNPPYTFRAVATDAAGNVGTSAALSCG